jgi:hypothetical protein
MRRFSRSMLWLGLTLGVTLAACTADPNASFPGGCSSDASYSNTAGPGQTGGARICQ